MSWLSNIRDTVMRWAGSESPRHRVEEEDERVIRPDPGKTVDPVPTHDIVSPAQEAARREAYRETGEAALPFPREKVAEAAAEGRGPVDTAGYEAVPELDPVKYVKGEWEGPWATPGRPGRLLIKDQIDPADPTREITIREPDGTVVRTTPKEYYGIDPATAKLIGAQFKADADIKAGIAPISLGRKELKVELDEMRDLYAAGPGAAGRAGAAGAAGAPVGPPFRYDWERPPEPRFERMEPREMDMRDPYPPPERTPPPEPFEPGELPPTEPYAPDTPPPEPYRRDVEKHRKLLGY